VLEKSFPKEAPMQIVRQTLRSQVRDVLLQRIRAGNVPWGEPINEVRLSSELGVSRTPLREALIELAASGHILSSDSQGFSFLEFNAAELMEVAPVIATLEALALRFTSKEDIIELSAELLRTAKEFNENQTIHDKLMEIDQEWHELMISGCPNEFLVNEITSIREAFHKYESLLVSSSASVARVAEEHVKIAESLAKGDLAKASEALMTNWVNGARRILEASSKSKAS
jgi:DNA-binding GntR family transcriptional regulator